MCGVCMCWQPLGTRGHLVVPASFALAPHEMEHVLEMLHAGRVTFLSGDTVLNRLASGTSLEDIAAELYPDATNGPVHYLRLLAAAICEVKD